MSKIRAVAIACLFHLTVAALAICQTPPGYLVKIELEEREDLARLLQDKINVVQDLGTFVLARVGISEIGFLTSTAFSVETLDSDWGYSDHYIVSLDRCPDPSRIGKVVYKDSNLAVVRRVFLSRLMPLGCDVKRVRTSPIRLREKSRERYGLLPNKSPDPLIQGMVDSVSTDTLEDYLRSLQGMGTRFSPTRGCSLAADYIKSRFESAGLTAELQSYESLPRVYDVCFIDDSVAWAVDDLGAIYKSLDGGQTWGEKHRHDEPLLGLCFLDSLRGWAVGGRVVLHTTDGGENWFAQDTTDAMILFRCTFVDSLFGWASGATPSANPVVCRTIDGGDSWMCTSQSFTGQFYGISFTDSLRGWTAGIDIDMGSGVIYATTDGGATWSLQFDTTGVRLFGVTFWDSLRGWVGGGDYITADAVLMATSDGGQSWNRQATPFFGMVLQDVDFVDPLNGWCVGWYTVLRTTDGGNNWLLQAAPASGLYTSIDMLDTLQGLLGAPDAAICYTFNSGNNWFLSNTGGKSVWYNVEAELPGVDLPDEIYIICGHHDDLSEIPQISAPGADDNASGVSGVLEAGRILSDYEFRRTVKFVTFSGEELGHVGSEAYASEAESLGLDIMGVVNLDMIGYLDDANHDLDIVCDLPSEWIADTIVRFCSTYVPSLSPSKVVDPTRVGSDHASFWDAGYCAIEQIERPLTNWNPYYHSTGDTVGTLDMPFVTEMVRLALASVAELADPYVVGISEASSARRRSNRLSLSIAGSPFSDRVRLRVTNTVSPVAFLKIYDSSGRLAKEFAPISNAEKVITWEGTGDHGTPVPSGVYFANLRAGAQTVSKKLVFVK